MKRIEIITPQQVPITYQLASLRERMLAFLLDSIIIFGVCTLTFVVIDSLSINSIEKSTLGILFISPIFIFYSLVWEIMSGGQSPGKIAMKIRVIKLNGSEMSLTDYFLRWAFRWVDIWGSLGTVAALQISSSGKGQRIGDLLADTGVIRIQGDYSIALKEILKIEDLKGYEPEYPQVTSMTEAEMLAIKMAIDQYKKYPNQSHRKIMIQCAMRMQERLQLPFDKTDPLVFLNRVLKDYVTITRS